MSAQLQISRVANLIASITLFYDHLLTFPAEIRWFWRRPRFNLGFVLFVANRYLAFLTHILTIIQVFIGVDPDNPARFRCTPIEFSAWAGIVIVQLLSGAIMAMRVYALYDKSRLVLALLCTLALGDIGYSIWAVFLDPSPSDTSYEAVSCARYSTLDWTMSIHTALAWAGQLLFDVVVFVLTMWKSIHLRRLGNHSLVDILFRDGLMYFGIMSAGNVANIATLLLGSSTYKSIPAVFVNSLTAIMVSRLMLNIREPAYRRPTRSHRLTMTSVIPVDDLSMTELSEIRRGGESQT